MLRPILMINILFLFLFISCQSPENEISDNIVVYPNPFIYNFNLVINTEVGSDIQVFLLSQKGDEIQLTDQNNPDQLITNNPIISETSSKSRISYNFNMEEMESGVYFLDVVVNDKAERIKLLKLEE